MTTAEVSKIVGIPRRTIAQWAVDFHLVLPEGAGRGRGKGRYAVWEHRHVDELKLIARLRNDFGFSMQHIRQIGDTLRAQGENPFSRGRFVAVSTKTKHPEIIRIGDERDAVSMLRQPGQLVFCIDTDPDGR